MTDGDLRVNRNLVIPASELEWRFSTSGGPGGQHANRAATRAEVRFDVAASAVLGPRQRQRLLERVGAVVIAAASDSRSQTQNRALALGRLAATIAGALRTTPPRRPTRPTAASKRRRLEEKRHAGRRKKLRRRPEGLE